MSQKMVFIKFNFVSRWSNMPVYKTENTAVDIHRADHATPLYPQKLALISPTSGGRSVGIVRSRTQATEFFFFFGPI
jgi:hypothetical protein